MEPKKLSAEDIKKLTDKDKVLYNRAVKLGFIIDSDSIKKQTDRVMTHLTEMNSKINKLSSNLDDTHPIFSKSKLGHSIEAIKGITLGLNGNQKALDSAYKSLDKLGLGWVQNTSDMLKWAVAAQNSNDLSKDLYNNMGLLGKGVVSAMSGLSNLLFGKKNMSLDEPTSETDKKEDQLKKIQKLELDYDRMSLEDKAKHLSNIDSLYLEHGKNRLNIATTLAETEQKITKAAEESKLDESSAAGFLKNLEETEKKAKKTASELLKDLLKSIENTEKETGKAFGVIEENTSRLGKVFDWVKKKLPFKKNGGPEDRMSLEELEKVDALVNQAKDSINIFGKNSKEATDLVALNMKTLAQEGGLVGKVLGGLGGKIGPLGNAITKFGFTSTAVMTKFAAMTALATAGISLLVAGFMAVGAGLYKVFQMAVSGRQELVKFDKVLGGIGEDGLYTLRQELNGISKELGHLGKTTEFLDEVVLGYMKSGVSLARSMSKDLIGTTAQVAEITGQSVESIGSFFGDLIKKINLSDKSLDDMSGSFIKYNRAANMVKGVIISFDSFKEAITSSSNALLVAASRGEYFTSRMMKDLTSLSGLATTLGLNIGEINGKFEDAGNLIGNMSSGFRSLLVVSGGANIDQMLNNTFDKTESMLKMSTYIQGLNKQFGGNINLTAQVVSQFGGISKEMALQLGRMTDKERQRIDEIRKFNAELRNDDVADSYNKITHELAATWDKVKAAFLNIFQMAVTKSGGVTSFVSKLTSIVDGFKNALTGDTAQRFIKGLTGVLDKLSGPFSNTLDTVLQLMEDFADPTKSMWSSIGSFLLKTFSGVVDILINTAKTMGELIVQGMLSGLSKSGGVLGTMIGRSERDIEINKIDNKLAEERGTKKQDNTYMLGLISAAGIAPVLAKTVWDKLMPSFDKERNNRINELDTKLSGKGGNIKSDTVNKDVDKDKVSKQHLAIALTENKSKLSKLERDISLNKDELRGFRELGLKPTDIAFGQKFKEGKWEGEERFMTIAERQQYLRKEIEYKEAEKEKTQKNIEKNTEDMANYFRSKAQEDKKQDSKPESTHVTKVAVYTPPPHIRTIHPSKI